MAQYATKTTLGGRPCYAWPGNHAASRRVANGYYCPRGMQPGIASVVMRRSEFEALAINSPQTLTMEAGNTLEFPDLYIVQAQQIAKAARDDGGAALLVTLADARHLFLRLSSIRKNYNVPVEESLHGVESAEFFTDTIPAGGSVPYTWQEILDDIWGRLPTSAPSPTLPSAPEGPPVNYCFAGLSAWEAYHVVLNDAGFCSRYKPTEAAFDLIDPQATDDLISELDARTADNSWPREDGSLILASVAATIPAKIYVAFHKRQTMHSSPTWMELTGGPLSSDPVVKEYTTGEPGAVSGTSITLQDSYPAELDVDGSITNDADLADRAEAVALAYLARLRKADALDNQVCRLTGFFPGMNTGSQVAALHWYDFGPLGGEMPEGAGTLVRFQQPGGLLLPGGGGYGGPLTARWPLIVEQGPFGARVGLTYHREMILCRLTGSLSPGGSVAAVRMGFDGSGWGDLIGSPAVTLWDSLQTFTGTAGDRCWAFWCRASGRYEIVQKKC